MHGSDAVGSRQVFHMVRFRDELSLAASGTPSSRLRVKLAGPLLDSIENWLEELASPTAGVPSLGNATMNSIFLDESGQVELPYGPEACTADPSTTSGGCSANLPNWSTCSPSEACPAPTSLCMRESSSTSIATWVGPKLDLARLARVVAVRVCLHYFDFSETMPTIPIGQADIGFLEWLIERARMMRTTMQNDDGLAVDVSGLTMATGTKTVLGGIDLRVPRGQRVAVLGPNGAARPRSWKPSRDSGFPRRGRSASSDERRGWATMHGDHGSASCFKR